MSFARVIVNDTSTIRISADAGHRLLTPEYPLLRWSNRVQRGAWKTAAHIGLGERSAVAGLQDETVLVGLHNR